MHPILRNVLAVIAGVVLGSVVNMLIVTVGPRIILPPEGADMTTMDGIQEAMKLFTPVNFIPPFLAHALGTLVGAFVAAKIAVSHNMKFALAIGFWFLLGGTLMVVFVGGPIWFIACDLLLAYIPMGWLGGMLAISKNAPSVKEGA